MKRKFGAFLVATLIFGVVLSLAGTVLTTQAKNEPMARKIVVFKSGVLNETARENLVKKVDGVKVKDLNLIDGKAVLLSPQAEKDLVRQAGVLRIDDDVEVVVLERPVLSLIKVQQTEVLPWGVDRIDAEKIWTTTTGDPIKVAVIDTGIDLRHPDLLSNIKGGYNAINPRKSPNDDNGHGTHVAGTMAAIKNTIGVVGVGPKINLYAVKVLGSSGSGYLSDVIEGLDWAIANGMQVVNMSLGTSSNVLSFKEAIQRVNAAGIVQVAAAGNNGGAVNYPAAYPEVIAVSAVDNKDKIASWSSRGSEIDLAAPGVSIYSTYRGSTYKTLSGTSMASPHVTGVAALVLTQAAKCDTDLNGSCSPTEVQQRLEATAEDLGASGKDYFYGSGLVDAEKAVIF